MCAPFRPLYKLLNSKLTNVNILCLVRFQPEQISAVNELVPEQWQLDRTITNNL